MNPISHTLVTACAHCGFAGATQRCSGCKRAHYCDAECQSAHWKAVNGHATECASGAAPIGSPLREIFGPVVSIRDLLNYRRPGVVTRRMHISYMKDRVERMLTETVDLVGQGDDDGHWTDPEFQKYLPFVRHFLWKGSLDELVQFMELRREAARNLEMVESNLKDMIVNRDEIGGMTRDMPLPIVSADFHSLLVPEGRESDFNATMRKYFSSIVNLRFKWNFNVPLEPGVLPGTLRFVDFGQDFNQALFYYYIEEKGKRRPKVAIILRPGLEEKYRTKVASILPPLLEELRLGPNYTKHLGRPTIPDSVRRLKFHIRGKPLPEIVLPKRLEFLELFDGDKETLDAFDAYCGEKGIELLIEGVNPRFRMRWL